MIIVAASRFLPVWKSMNLSFSSLLQDTTDDDTDDQLSWGEPEPAKPVTLRDIIDAKSKTVCEILVSFAWSVD